MHFSGRCGFLLHRCLVVDLHLGRAESPVAGDFVVIPAGNTILLDESTPVLRILLLQGKSQMPPLHVPDP